MVKTGEFLNRYGLNKLISLPESAFCWCNGEKFVKAEFL